jgi:DNA uptake protein ComE-like DNA-binding protein
MAFLDWLTSAALKSKIQNDPYYRFQSLSEIQTAANLGIQIDANQAAIDDWLRLPGLSIHQARMLTQLTQSGIQFFCIEDVAAALGLSIQRLKPVEPILKFCYYEPDSVFQIQRVSLNTASVEQLSQIPVMKPVLARAIARNRQTNGDYKNIVDLQQRLSLTNQLTADLMHYLAF